MPLYEFHCNHCEADFESLSKPNEPVACSLCQMQGAERRFPLVAGHVWKCKADGSGSTRASANQEEDRRLGKRERVTAMLDRQAKEL